MKSVEALLAQYETKTLKAKLREFPALIREAKSRLNAAKQELHDAEADRQTAEADLMMAIMAETDDKGKPKFSNAEMRAAELTRRKAQDEDYRVAAEAVRRAEERVSEAQTDLDMLIDEFKAYRYVVKLTATELALLADDEDDENGDNGAEPF